MNMYQKYGKKTRENKWFKEMKETIDVLSKGATVAKTKGILTDEDWAATMKLCHELIYKLEVERLKL